MVSADTADTSFGLQQSERNELTGDMKKREVGHRFPNPGGTEGGWGIVTCVRTNVRFRNAASEQKRKKRGSETSRTRVDV